VTEATSRRAEHVLEVIRGRRVVRAFTEQAVST
jgi:hypothetical protein